MNAEPAYSIIEVLGGVRRVSAITGRHYSRIYRWMYSEKRGGTDGVIPAREQQKLLRFAQSNAIDLLPADFFDATRLQHLLRKDPVE